MLSSDTTWHLRQQDQQVLQAVTAQPPYTPKDLSGIFKCLDCPDEPAFSSDQELKKHKDEVHGVDVQGKQTNTVPGISKESGY